jgi:hypothetical protein
MQRLVMANLTNSIICCLVKGVRKLADAQTLIQFEVNGNNKESV